MTEMYLTDSCIEIVLPFEDKVLSIYYKDGKTVLFEDCGSLIDTIRAQESTIVDLAKFAQLVGKLK